MIKVQQTKQNACFLEAAGDYLVSNGYTRSAASHINGSIRFIKGDTLVIVYGDNVDFLTSDAGEPDQRNAHFSRFMALTGISELDLFKWMLMFHIADIVPMQQFIKEAKKEEPADVTGFIVQIFDHFKAEPISY